MLEVQRAGMTAFHVKNPVACASCHNKHELDIANGFMVCRLELNKWETPYRHSVWMFFLG
jgi:hypothetical protein